MADDHDDANRAAPDAGDDPVARINAVLNDRRPGRRRSGREPLDPLLSDSRILIELGAQGFTRDDIQAAAAAPGRGLLGDILSETRARLQPPVDQPGSDQPADVNSLAPGAPEKHPDTPKPPAADDPAPLPPPSVRIGDVPEPITRRYFTERARWRAQDGYYESSAAPRAVFHDRGDRLIAGTDSPAVVADLVDIARHRQWQTVHVTGTAEFRRTVWFEAQTSGLTVTGYRPTERDQQALARRQTRDASRPDDRPAASSTTAPTRSDETAPHVERTASPTIRHYLDVPFAARDAAKAAGARWDAQARQWYATSESDPAAIARWRRTAPGGPDEPNLRAQLQLVEEVVRRALPDQPADATRLVEEARRLFAARLKRGETVPRPQVKVSDPGQRAGGAIQNVSGETPVPARPPRQRPYRGR